MQYIMQRIKYLRNFKESLGKQEFKLFSSPLKFEKISKKLQMVVQLLKGALILKNFKIKS